LRGTRPYNAALSFKHDSLLEITQMADKKAPEQSYNLCPHQVIFALPRS